MTNFIQMLALVNSLLPILLGTIRMVETMFPQSGQGEAKFKMVTETIEAAAQATGVAENQLPVIAAIIKPMINNIVALAKRQPIPAALQGAQTGAGAVVDVSER